MIKKNNNMAKEALSTMGNIGLGVLCTAAAMVGAAADAITQAQINEKEKYKRLFCEFVEREYRKDPNFALKNDILITIEPKK